MFLHNSSSDALCLSSTIMILLPKSHNTKTKDSLMLMRLKTSYSIGFCFVFFTAVFSQQDSCSKQTAFAKAWAPHDLSIDTWRFRGLWSGIFFPAVGPLAVGVVAANTKVNLPSNDSTGYLGKCFNSEYSHQVTSGRIKEVAKCGAIGTGLGVLFYIIVFATIFIISNPGFSGGGFGGEM